MEDKKVNWWIRFNNAFQLDSNEKEVIYKYLAGTTKLWIAFFVLTIIIKENSKNPDSLLVYIMVFFSLAYWPIRWLYILLFMPLFNKVIFCLKFAFIFPIIWGFFFLSFPNPDPRNPDKIQLYFNKYFHMMDMKVYGGLLPVSDKKYWQSFLDNHIENDETASSDLNINMNVDNKVKIKVTDKRTGLENCTSKGKITANERYSSSDDSELLKNEIDKARVKTIDHLKAKAKLKAANTILVKDERVLKEDDERYFYMEAECFVCFDK